MSQATVLEKLGPNHSLVHASSSPLRHRYQVALRTGKHAFLGGGRAQSGIVDSAWQRADR